LRPVVGRIVHEAPAESAVALDSSRRSKNSTVVEDYSEFNQSLVRADVEEVEEWTNIVRNVVDLEGIANDGLGYTVTITGPNQPRRAKRWFNAATTNLLDPRRRINRAPPNTILNLEIPLKTEVQIEESYRSKSFAESSSRNPRSQRPSYDEKAMEEMYPDLFGQVELTTVPPFSVDAAEDGNDNALPKLHGRG
jgi:hypothetical protein